jgi:2-polyprenyl-3-methyl-5-hydroxy-6-metoxy-1,4-benzoquinol methylase
LKINYEGHDNAYIKKIKEGFIGWDQEEEEYQYFSDLIIKNYSGEKNAVLEIGCGMGNILFLLKDHFKNRVGVDVASSAIEYAKLRDPFGQYICGDFLKNNIDGKFDLVIESKVLHCIHPKDRKSFLMKAKQYLKPEGRLMGSHMIGPVYGLEGYDEATGILSVRDYFSRYIPLKKEFLISEFKECGFEFKEINIRVSTINTNIEYMATALEA